MSSQRPRVKGTVFRVTGLPLETTLDDLNTALSKFLSEEITIDTKQTTLAPSCYDNKTQTALVQFEPFSPNDLEALRTGHGCEIEYKGHDISIDKDFYGLTQLYPTTGEIETDIIAVSGLNGHAYGSWRGRGGLRRMWPRHFLSEDFPNCRTMIFGYNSKLTDNATHTTLDYAKGFLEELRKSRQTEEEKERPIIFIGHSFGGVVIAQSLIKARSSEDAFLHSLFLNTRATIFFGTPHRGLLVDDILAMLGEGSPREDLVRSLEGKSDLLKKELSEFITYSRSFKIVSFHETGLTRKLQQDENGRWSRSGPYITTVERESSILQLPGGIEASLPAEGDHSEMVKFNHKTRSLSYTSVVRILRNLLSKPTETGKCEGQNKDTDSSLDNIPDGDEGMALLPLSKSEAELIAEVSERNTALYEAVRKGDAEETERLLEKGAYVSTIWGGRTLLHIAAQSGYAKVADLLLQGGANVMTVNHMRGTPLHTACWWGHYKVAEVLLQGGAKVTARGNNGGTPLHFTTQRGHDDVVELLLQYGANIETKNDKGNTPLHNAAIHGHPAVVKVLLSNGANTGVKNKQGFTPLKLAEKNRHVEVQNILKGIVATD